MVKIEKKITGMAVVDPENTPAPPALPDENPLLMRIENRPDASLDAKIEKVKYNTHEGAKKVYIAVSFMPVEGRINGQSVTIERPIEIFLPAGQTEEDGQWIVATMRNLSLAARAGFLTRALQDLRQVPWTKGPVRCGEHDYGNGKVVPLHHPSEVAAIAYAIQRILRGNGYLDAENNQVPVEVLARRYNKQAIELTDDSEPEPEQKSSTSDTQIAQSIGTGQVCPQCKGTNVRPLDGCDTCMDCGHSKCG